MTNMTPHSPQSSSVTKRLRRLAARACLLVLSVCGIFGAQAAQAQITIQPASWNVIGLDSNNPQTGPAEYPVGARVCNTGGAAINNLAVQFIWDSSNPYINLKDPSRATLTTPSLAAGACLTYYFDVVVTRNSAAHDTARRFRITARGDGTSTVSTPSPRELYVEKLISQGRNEVQSITGPTTVYVGQTYTYTVDAKTAPGGYEQLEAFLNLSSVVFEVQSVQTTYTEPFGGTNDKIYADACGWRNDPTLANYRSCTNNDKAGGTIRTIYTVKVLSTGTTVATTLIRDFSGSSYHYNSDFGVKTISITALLPPADLSGTIFEDVNYGGAAGRSRAASGGAGRDGVRVELYNAAGGFVTSTTTSTVAGVAGRYTFAAVAAGNYTVRVVNSTVTSSRPGTIAGLLPVQTFRTDASSGTPQPDTARVGGQNPQVADAPAGAAGTTINTTTGVFTAGTVGTAQSITPVAQNGANVTGIDFGFNFSTIVNTNNAGQGSLRQFIINSNALTNLTLAQSGLIAARETSIFNIPAARLTSGAATITLLSALPAITDPNTSIDGTRQTAATGDTNPSIAGQTTGPEIIIDVSGGGAGLTISAENVIVDSLGITGANTVGANVGYGIALTGNVAGRAIIRNNTIWSNDSSGIRLTANSNLLVSANVIRANGVADATADGITFSGTGDANRITENSIHANGNLGIDLAAADTPATGNGVTLNDTDDTDTGVNGLLNFPVLQTAHLIGNQLVVTGWARPGAAIEFFVAAPDPSGFGEGQTFIVTRTEGTAEDADATASSYTATTIPGRNVGADTTNRFRFILPVSTVGTVITATATVADSTSEFSNVVTVANAPPAITLCKTLAGQTCVPQDITFPQQLPGSDISYVINFANTGGQSATGFVILDPVPANTDLKVGTPAATLGTTGMSVAIEYSSDGGTTWTYTPTSGAGGAPAGYDRAATHVRWRFTNALSPTAPNNAGSVAFAVRIR